jgi:hypothetical protein
MKARGLHEDGVAGRAESERFIRRRPRAHFVIEMYR